MLLNKTGFRPCYANEVDPFMPQLWANESVAILLESMVAAQLVHRDFEPTFAKFGQVVNTRKPREFQAKRKGVNDSVTVQNAGADNIDVKLNLHVHVSFMIKDGEDTKSFKDLVEEFLKPAAQAMAREADQMVLGQVYQFLENSAGAIGGLSTSNGPVYITDTRKVMNINKAHLEGRNLIVGPNAEAKLLQNSIFIQANTVGDDGGAMAEARLGKKFGFNIWMCQNMSSVPEDVSLVIGAVNEALGYPKGTTVLTVDGFTGDIFNTTTDTHSRWIRINGVPYHVVDSALTTTNTTAITLEYGLRDAVENDDVIEVSDFGNVETNGQTDDYISGGNYLVGYNKNINVEAISGGDISVGQLVTFGKSNVRYAVIETDGSTYVRLDRALEAQVNDEATICLGPAGDYNWAFHRNAVTLVVRPLHMPRQGVGAVAGMAMFGGVAIRTTITYDGEKQGHLVTLDFLAGIKVLDTALGAVMLS